MSFLPKHYSPFDDALLKISVQFILNDKLTSSDLATKKMLKILKEQTKSLTTFCHFCSKKVFQWNNLEIENDELREGKYIIAYFGDYDDFEKMVIFNNNSFIAICCSEYCLTSLKYDDLRIAEEITIRRGESLVSQTSSRISEFLLSLW